MLSFSIDFSSLSREARFWRRSACGSSFDIFFTRTSLLERRISILTTFVSWMWALAYCQVLHPTSELHVGLGRTRSSPTCFSQSQYNKHHPLLLVANSPLHSESSSLKLVSCRIVQHGHISRAFPTKS